MKAVEQADATMEMCVVICKPNGAKTAGTWPSPLEPLNVCEYCSRKRSQRTNYPKTIITYIFCVSKMFIIQC